MSAPDIRAERMDAMLANVDNYLAAIKRILIQEIKGENPKSYLLKQYEEVFDETFN